MLAGRVYIVGAGPGDPDLLTRKAARLIEHADIILHDRLVTAEILALCNPRAILVDVGKEDGHHAKNQDQINWLMRDFAKRGCAVVRLKGGDPFLFGRGAEEVLFLREHDIPVEWVPGVSSAFASPEAAGIPVVYRGIAKAFTVVTGCGAGSGQIDWSRYARVETLAILMGVARRCEIARDLIAAGRDANEPVAFIESGTRPSQCVVEATLQEVAEGYVEVSSPAIFVIGEVVKLRHQLIPALEEALCLP